ncbi:MAG: DUF4249 domain-containing protein [Bacteroidetes bacterium]|nr:DUF4249 domain-containing protein [Bacteroidota bacterium]
MKNPSILLMTFIIALLSSCTKVVDLKLNEPESKIAVEGFISNQIGGSFVKLAYTKGYLASEGPEFVNDAQVSVSDSKGNLTLFTATDNEEIYLPPADFVGESGESYTLDVQYDEGSVSAQALMRDTVFAKNVNVIKTDVSHPYLEAGQHLMATISKYQKEDSYYQAEIYVNGIKRMGTASDIIVFDDRLYDQNDELELRIALWADELDEEEKPQMGDVLSVQFIRISEETYAYLQALSETPMQGGLFGRTPANVPSNIQGGLGWFQASSFGSPQHALVME